MMNKSSTTKAPEHVQLPPSWQPSGFDVICGRGSIALQHAGNKRLKALVRSMLPQYNDCKCKFQKSSLVSSIVSSVQQASPEGGFVKFVEDGWVRVSERHAREKVGQIFRDSLSGKYKSSTLSKSQRRRDKMYGSGDESSRGSMSIQDYHRSESPSSFGPSKAQGAYDIKAASLSDLAFSSYPPSVINVGGLSEAKAIGKASANVAASASNNTGNNASSGQVRPYQQLALMGDIEPLPVDSTENISLENLNLFDLDFVSNDSVSFYNTLNEKNIDELCDIIFEECGDWSSTEL